MTMITTILIFSVHFFRFGFSSSSSSFILLIFTAAFGFVQFSFADAVATAELTDSFSCVHIDMWLFLMTHSLLFLSLLCLIPIVILFNWYEIFRSLFTLLQNALSAYSLPYILASVKERKNRHDLVIVYYNKQQKLICAYPIYTHSTHNYWGNAWESSFFTCFHRVFVCVCMDENRNEKKIESETEKYTNCVFFARLQVQLST